MALKREQILNADDLKVEYVKVPEWAQGGEDEVCIKMLTGTERDKFEASMVRVNKAGKPEQNLENLRARLIVLCAIDPDDNNLPLFTDDDIRSLGKKSAIALDRVFTAAQKLNGFTEEDIEELAEGFSSAPSESSTSA
jgi:hypothetical protein